MTILEGIALGSLQGATEFLPVSSSGHLVVMQSLFGLKEIPLLFDVILHLATLSATILVFRKRIGAIFAAIFRWVVRKARPEDQDDLRAAVAIIVGTFATGVLGILIEKFAPGENLKLVSACFLITAALLFVSERLGQRLAEAGTKSPGLREGLLVGLAQGIGVFPGISRSGITISASLAAGIEREKAGEFSFLLSLPAILGAFILQLKDADTLLTKVDPTAIIAGFVAAFAVGLFALKVLLALVKRGRLSWFALYLIPLGIAGLFFL